MCCNLDGSCASFCRLIVSGKISTIYNLRWRGLSSRDSASYICCLCGRDTELIEHLSVHFHVAVSLWGFFLKQSGVGWFFPKSLVELIESWTGGVPFVRCAKILWRNILFSILWSIWKEGIKELLDERNHLGRVFLHLCY